MKERRFFIAWIGAAVAGLAGVLWFRKKRAQPAVEKITLLTQDGRLVQVDKTAVSEQKRRKVTHEELLTWVKKKH